MKIKPDDFEELRILIGDCSKLNEYLASGLSAKRWRWDCLYLIPRDARNAWFERVYQYADDTHIDTALRKITGSK